ncbi:MAG: cation-efflux pump, partial [Lachnospiraceae bacterium]|nr:cation-efflux pump [Lachnospiraceae bacterium]
QEGVEGVDSIQSRMFGNRIYIDLEIRVDRYKTVGEGHAIAEKVHDLLEESFEEVKHVMVHVNPTEE